MFDIDIAADTELGQRAIDAVDRYVRENAVGPFREEKNWPISRAQIVGLRQIAVNEPGKAGEFAEHQRTKVQAKLDATANEERQRELKSAIGGDVITIHARDPVALAWQITSKFGVQAEIADGSIRVEREGGHRLVPELIEAFPGAIESVSIGRPTLGDVFHRATGHTLHPDMREIT